MRGPGRGLSAGARPRQALCHWLALDPRSFLIGWLQNHVTEYANCLYVAVEIPECRPTLCTERQEGGRKEGRERERRRWTKKEGGVTQHALLEKNDFRQKTDDRNADRLCLDPFNLKSMSAASVLRSFSPSAMPGPVMPMDVAMRFYISHSPPPLRGFLSPYEDLQRAKTRATQSSSLSQQQRYKPLRPCLSNQQKAADDNGGGDCVGWNNNRTSKKRVVFADMKGMSLTAIHVFSKFDDESYQSKKTREVSEDLQFDMTDLETAAMDLKISTVRSLALDFKQPSADYLDFRNRLIQSSVCLENCSLQERSLTGTVKVRNIGFEKSVQVRITFDSWASFTDVECTFMNNVYGGQDSDTFAFVLELPAYVQPQNRVEFCICFKVQGQVFWDNNDGKNYSLKHVGWHGEEVNAAPASPEHKHGSVKVLDLDIDQFGSPRMSNGLFPGWQSWGQIDTSVPYW
ncbi:protein phosphatase 1 regulatory subunit 3C-B-like [Sphaeramia orbicularis]|uniref:Protein phosphatase 1 regulatory subunit 3C-B-like n=1 Tax=Sphaeramia orbicularis TaxID=375764 RepID=A0A673B8Y4_9TELE|nr:protein phosphatase 1 regulatory subunit 3C-B-like [Sphaeramia orbicularis]